MLAANLGLALQPQDKIQFDKIQSLSLIQTAQVQCELLACNIVVVWEQTALSSTDVQILLHKAQYTFH